MCQTCQVTFSDFIPPSPTGAPTPSASEPRRTASIRGFDARSGFDAPGYMGADSRPVCIIGLGLIGGSLLRDVRRIGRAAFGWDRSPATVKAARHDGFDVADSLPETLRRAEADDALIILAVPMPAVGRVLDAVAEHAPHCGITDVVSVKQKVLVEIQKRGMEDRYVGGHPMSGTAHSGWEASQERLFRGAPWVVTFDNVPGETLADRRGLENLSGLSHGADGGLDQQTEAHTEEPHRSAADNWRRERWLDVWIRVVRLAMDIEAEVVPARAHTHDAAVARISHVPHILAETLAVVGDNGGTLALTLAAGSFRDGTRVAGTAPALVQAMCENNVEDVLAALDEAISMLSDARAQLAGPECTIEDLAVAGYRSRVRFEARSGKRPVIRLRPGAPGWVAQLAHAENLGGRIEIF